MHTEHFLNDTDLDKRSEEALQVRGARNSFM